MPNTFDHGGNIYTVGKVETISGHPLEVISSPTSTSVDAFGRQKVSTVFTLFDSKHRYYDNGLFATTTGGSATTAFSSGEGLINLNVTTASGDKIIRETEKVFSYQPGKSLLSMSSFVMNSGVANRRQRVGYFSVDNGIYFEQSGLNGISIVKRDSITGDVRNTIIDQADWNIDPLDGTGPSAITLDPTKAQIFWSDMEWLGIGTIRAGFIINGKQIHCHSFQHANQIESTYMTTASLPIRYEIENLDTATVTGQMKQICSTVISEGGYQLKGISKAIGLHPSEPKDLTATGNLYPVVALRLKSSRPDAVVVLNHLSLAGITNNAIYRYHIERGGISSGGTWVSAGADSSVEYNITATGYAEGENLLEGYAAGSNQGNVVIDIPQSEVFKYQLTRDSEAGTMYELTLAAETNTAGADILATVTWEEV